MTTGDQEFTPQGLPICSECGWAMANVHFHRCDVAGGKLADELIAASPVPATRYGYGRAVAFKFGPSRTLVVEINNGRLTFGRLHWADVETRDTVLALVRGLAEVNVDSSPPKPMREDPVLIAAVGDAIRELEGRPIWSSRNLPGRDLEVARRILAVVDVQLTGRREARSLLNALDKQEGT